MHEIPNAGPMRLYEVNAERCRVVPFARVVQDNREAAAAILQPEFDPTQEVVIQGTTNTDLAEPNRAASTFELAGDAAVVEENSQRLRIKVSAPHGGFLVLSDTYYPGWHVKVDGVESALYRANISVRAVRLPAGARAVEFSYDATPFWRGLRIAGAGVVSLMLWVLLAMHFDRQLRKV